MTRAVVGALFVLFVLACAGCGANRPPELPRYFTVPPFTLRDQNAHAFSSSALEGKVWIADFVFTNCRDVCPLLTTQLASVRRRLAGQADTMRYVSLTVDPRRDDPSAMLAFSHRMHAEGPDWMFLTGPPAEVARVVHDGFKQVMEENPSDDSHTDVLHGTRFLLLDQHAVVRGVYDTSTEGLAELVTHAKQLVVRGPGSR